MLKGIEDPSWTWGRLYHRFLAAMSSSRSDDVTKFVRVFVCSCVVIFFSLEHSKHLKQDVLRKLQECLRGVCLKFQGCFKEVSSMLQGSFKAVNRKFQGSF